MQIYAARGQRAAALRQFQACEKIIRQELDAEPEAETAQLYDSIRNHGLEEYAAISPATGKSAAASDQAVPGHTHSPRPDKNAPVSAGTRLADGSGHGLRAVGAGPLRWALVGAAVATLLVGVGVWTLLWPAIQRQPLPIVLETVERARPAQMAYPLPDQPSIAVLPFQNLGDDADQSDLISGINEGITGALSIMSEMFVISRDAVQRYEGAPFEPKKIAEELGVRYLLTGSVQRSGDQVRIRARLIDAVRGSQLWADRYDRQMTELFTLQDEITREIVTALQVEMTEGEQERISLRHGTDNVDAWMLAGHGLKMLRRMTLEDNARARDLYRRAAALDPTYAGAWDGVAWTHFLDAKFGWSPSPVNSIRRATELSQKALALDPTRPRTYALLGNLSLISEDYDQAIELLEKAVALSPNGADVVAVLGLALTYTGGLRSQHRLAQPRHAPQSVLPGLVPLEPGPGASPSRLAGAVPAMAAPAANR